MDNHPGELDSKVEGFPNFHRLALEIRLMIWEYTWPGPRMMDVALGTNPRYDIVEKGDNDDENEEENEHEPPEIVNLRLVGTLSTMLKEDLTSLVIESTRVEFCPDPAALHVCQESRRHTLSEYRVMTSLFGNFYYSPKRDVMFFSVDAADDYPEHAPKLKLYHEMEMNTIETALVLDEEWPDEPRRDIRGNPMGYTLNCLALLGGLKTIQIYQPVADSDSGGEVRDGSGLGQQQETDHFHAQAKLLRDDFPRIIQREKCTATRIEVLDCDGNVY